MSRVTMEEPKMSQTDKDIDLEKKQKQESYFFSAVITVSGDDTVNQLLSSIYKDPIAGNIQVLLVSEADSEEDSLEAVEAVYREKVQLVKAHSFDLADVYAAVKSKILGRYVCFLSDRMYYAGNTFSAVYEKLQQEETGMAAIQPVFIDSMENQLPYPIVPSKEGMIDAREPANMIHFYLPACFIAHTVLQECGFDLSVQTEKDKALLLKYYVEYGTYYYLPGKALYYLDSAENEFATNMIQYEKDWYLHDVRYFLLDRVKKAQDLEPELQRLVQTSVLYLLFARYNCNSNDRNKKVLNDEELEMFVGYTKDVLSYIPEAMIQKNRKLFRIPRSLKYMFLRFRYEALGCRFQLLENGSNFSFLGTEDASIRKEYVISKIRAEKIAIMAINYEKNKLKIDFKSNLIDFLDADDIQIKVYYGKKEAKIKEIYCYPLIKSFGKTILKRKQYQVTIPLEATDIAFFLVLNGKEYSQSITYTNAAARLTLAYAKSYWNVCGDYVLYHNGSKKVIRIRQMSKTHRLIREVRLLKQIRKKKKNDDYQEMRKLRIQYFRKKRSYQGKRIWIMFDKLYKGGDNGEYMYHYLKEHPELGITPYYIINEDAPDYARLKAAGENLLITNSPESRMMCLQAEAILATHTSIWNYCGFSKQQQEYVRDLLNAKIICIQHGLTVQKIAQYQNRLFDNTRFYCCASKYEVENILQPIYGYAKKDVVLTGLARYDGLKNADKKQILITPTWRRDIVNNGIACRKKTHNAHFKDSIYFKVYNGLINNEELIRVAKETGYQIIYLLHPAMSAQSVDYDRNDYVQIVEATGDMSYEKILTESSLMVTDYSGVQFDFAYMRKPVVYYHPEVLPPFYEEGVFQYESMGFGEICCREKELVDTLCDYMKTECQTKPFYMERADSFFAFDDFDSCARIFQEVDKFLKRN